MLKELIRYILMFLILIVLQAVIFNHICLFGVAIPFIFIYLLIKLPVTVSVNISMTIGFLLGLTIDIFSDTQGMNAFACLTVAALRKPILHLYLPREDDMSDPIPSVKSMGSGSYNKYAFSVCLVYCTIVFLIESFTFFNFGRLLAKIIGSAVLSFMIFYAIESFKVYRSEKRL